MYMDLIVAALCPFFRLFLNCVFFTGLAVHCTFKLTKEKKFTFHFSVHKRLEIAHRSHVPLFKSKFCKSDTTKSDGM